MKLRRLPGRPRPGPTDDQGVPGSGAEHAAVAGTPGPTRPLLSASVEESDGRHLSSQVIQATGPSGPPGPVLVRIHEFLRRSGNPDATLIWAISSLAFFVFFRLGELLVDSATSYSPSTSLSWGDVAVDNIRAPSMLRVHLKQSKCDQFGKGVDIIVGRTLTAICPVGAVLDYIQLREDRPGAFFINNKREPVTKSWLVQQIRRTLRVLGLPQGDYAGHSFRIGAATSAAMAGIEDSKIQALGRWQSSAFLRYVRMSREQLAAVSTTLATAAMRDATRPQAQQGQ